MNAASVPLPVAVIGAGPVGLAAAAQLATRRLDFALLEAGESVAASVARWAHVRLFSPWRFNIDPAARALLESVGWHAPDGERLPTGGELISDYLAPLAVHPAVAPHVRYRAEVTAIARQGIDKVRTAGRDDAPFVLRLSDRSELLASAVIDASGTWRTPNHLGGNGLVAHGEAEARAAGSVFDGMPDVLGSLRSHFAGRSVAVVGAGHSATGTLLALAELATQAPGTTVSWVLRRPDPSRSYRGADADALPARGSIGTHVKAVVDQGRVSVHTGFFVREVTSDGLVSTDGRKAEARVIVNATGARPDHTPATELRLDVDPILGSTRALAPLIDPNKHACATVPPHGVDGLAHPESRFFVVGAKSYGRAPTFLLATGYEQARSVVAALAGDWEAARDVRLELPETGVWTSSIALNDDENPAAGGCCGTPTAASQETRGLATGIAGGLLSLSLVSVTEGAWKPEGTWKPEERCMLKIVVADLSGPQIAEFLGEHVREMRSITPIESAYVLDLDGLRRPEITFWSVLDGDTLVGCGAIKRLGAGHAELKSMRTKPARKRSGIASLLLEHIIVEARRMGFSRLSLETGSAEFFQPARRLYEKFGFEYCEPFGDYRHGPHNVFMTRAI